jgi:hypothetical protein
LFSGLRTRTALRVVARASGGLDGISVVPSAPGQAEARLHLGAMLPDGDADGVPDKLDDCPSIADSDQANQRGTGLGDACACPSQAPLCDGFEHPGLDTRKWKQRAYGSASASVDTAQHHGVGRASLHASNDALAQYQSASALLYESGVTEASPSLYLRAFVRVPADFATDTASIFSVEDSNRIVRPVRLQLVGTSLTVDGDVTSPNPIAPAGSFSYDTWFCLEWGLQLGSNSIGNRVWTDGSEVSGLNTSLGRNGIALNQVAFGLQAFAANGAVAARGLWLDDVVVSTMPIGCN